MTGLLGTRGMSTPLDVALGLLLVGAAVSVIAGIQPAVPDTPDSRGSVLLGSQMEITYETSDGPARVSGTMGGLLGEAVRAGTWQPDARDKAFRRAVAEAADSRVSDLGPPIQIIGYCSAKPRASASLVVGETVPPEIPIRATVYELPSGGSGSSSSTDRCQPAIVVRRWSP